MELFCLKKIVLVGGLFLAAVCSAVTNEVVQCWSVTKSGNRCKRRAVAGERYCKQHSSSRTVKKAPEKCRSFTTDGKSCSSKPVVGKRYCERHLK